MISEAACRGALKVMEGTHDACIEEKDLPATFAATLIMSVLRFVLEEEIEKPNFSRYLEAIRKQEQARTV